MTQKEIHIAIIGGGVSGLRTAELIVKNKDAHINIKTITLFEASSTLGGVLNNTKSKGYLLEHGAQGVLLSRQSFNRCIDEFNLSDELLFPSPSKTRYLMTPSKIVPLGPNILLLKKYGILKFRDFFRIFLEFFIKRPQNSNPNETVHSFFARHFGKKFADTLLVSLTFGIWGGGSKRMLVRYIFPKLIKLEFGYGSLLKGVLYSFFKNIFQKKEKSPSGLASFKNGMKHLTDQMYLSLKEMCIKNRIDFIVYKDTKINSIVPSDNGIQLNNLNETLYDCIVYAGQPWRDENLHIENLPKPGNDAWQELKNIESHSIAVVGLGGQYHVGTQKPIAGFGALAGQWSKDILGVMFIHSIYPLHAPKNCFLYRVMLGGDRALEINSKTDRELIELAKDNLIKSGILHKESCFEIEQVVKWKNYIPLATEHQDTVLKSIWQLEALVPGLFFTGNYIKGVSISDCLEQAEETSANILKYLKSIPG